MIHLELARVFYVLGLQYFSGHVTLCLDGLGMDGLFVAVTLLAAAPLLLKEACSQVDF